MFPCSPRAHPNERFVLERNGSLTSGGGGCVRSRAGSETEATLQLNATVWHTLNSSAVAAGNYPPLTPGMPAQREPPQNFQKTLLLYHNGHETSTARVFQCLLARGGGVALAFKLCKKRNF